MILSPPLRIARVSSIILRISWVSASTGVGSISAVSVSPLTLASASIAPSLLTRLVGVGVL